MFDIPLIILFNLILYWKTLKFGIIVDDIKQYQTIKEGSASSSNILQSLKIRLYGGGTFGLYSIPDHALAIFFHTCICVLMYMALGYDKIALTASLLYACNSANLQTAVWLNGRRYAITIILLLLMMVYQPWGLILYFATFFFQVTAVLAPILFITKYPLLALAIPILIALNWADIKEVVDIRIQRIVYEGQRKFTPKRLIIITKSFGFYFFKMLFPGRTLMQYRNLFWWGIEKKKNEECYKPNLEFWKGIVAFIAIGAGLFYFKGQNLLMWIFMFLSVLQWCAIIPFFQINTDRYISLPNVFMMYFLAYFIHMTPFANEITIGILTMYSTGLLSNMEMYRSIDDFHRYQLYYCPDITIPRRDRIKYYMRKTQQNPYTLFTAWGIIEEGLRYNPDDYIMLYHAAECAWFIGAFPQAEKLLDLAEKNFYLNQEDFQSKEVHRLRGMIPKVHDNAQEKERRMKQRLKERKDEEK